jgi:hypothetical protein
MKRFSYALAYTSLALGISLPVYAAPCRDARGKFIKCPTKAAPKAVKCKDAKGKFTQCGTPGARPI